MSEQVLPNTLHQTLTVIALYIHWYFSSISSWSDLGRTRSINSGDTASLSPDSEIAPSTILEKENEDLVSRLAELQQEKWTLEEKVQ